MRLTVIQFAVGHEDGHCESLGKGEVPAEESKQLQGLYGDSILWQWNGNICMQLLFIKRHCWLFRQVCLFRRAVPGFKYHLRHL